MRNRSQAEPRDAAAAPLGAPPSDLPTPLLGGLTPAQFMRGYWQKKPLLIRQAIPGVASPVSRDALFELAADYDAESRLITHFRNKWQLSHGPFEPGSLPAVTRKAWTLLVQGLDLHVDAARALLDRFRFIPDARLDDLMISYATDGGGVGPHFDSYDVFLLQVEGRRRWRVGAQKDLSLQPDVPLKILENFEPSDEWVLEPGDMLYLPPHIAHDGVAEGECMTCSIGFRARPPANWAPSSCTISRSAAACATGAATTSTATRSNRPSTRPRNCLRRWSSVSPRSSTRSAGASATSPNSSVAT